MIILLFSILISYPPLGVRGQIVKYSAMVLSACAGKNDNAAMINITAKVITPKVTVSVSRVPAEEGINFFSANNPAIAT